MAWWALKTVSGDVFTWGGMVIVHDNRQEMEFLFPGRECVDVTESVLPKVNLRNHPQIAGQVRFPLDRNDFREPVRRN